MFVVTIKRNMSQRKWPLPTSTSRRNKVKNDQGPFAQTSQGKIMTEVDIKKVAIAPDGSIFVKTLVQIDPDSDLFMKVAQSAYADHERSLVQCSKCKRKFFPDRIEKHQTNCAAEKLPPSLSKSQQEKSRPRK